MTSRGAGAQPARIFINDNDDDNDNDDNSTLGGERVSLLGGERGALTKAALLAGDDKSNNNNGDNNTVDDNDALFALEAQNDRATDWQRARGLCAAD